MIHLQWGEVMKNRDLMIREAPNTGAFYVRNTSETVVCIRLPKKARAQGLVSFECVSTLLSFTRKAGH